MLPGWLELRDFAVRYTAAWCSQNPASVAAFFSEDGSLRVNEDPPAIGRDAVAQMAHAFMAAFAGLSCELSMRIVSLRLGMPAALSLLIPLRLSGAELKQETVDVFNHYIAALETHLATRWQGQGFLWSDGLAHREELKQGAVLIAPASGNGNSEINGGMIQDWAGAIFIPSADIASVLAVAQDYGHHEEIYKPEVITASVRSRTGDDFIVHMRLLKSKLFLSVVLDTEHEIHFVAVDSKRVYSRAYSTRIAEISNPGKPNERELPVGKDRGLLWRMNGYWFFEERAGGVIVECESVTLTRDIPFGMRALLSPIVKELPAEALRKSLESTRKAVLDRR